VVVVVELVLVVVVVVVVVLVLLLVEVVVVEPGQSVVLVGLPVVLVEVLGGPVVVGGLVVGGAVELVEPSVVEVRGLVTGGPPGGVAGEVGTVGTARPPGVVATPPGPGSDELGPDGTSTEVSEPCPARRW